MAIKLDRMRPRATISEGFIELYQSSCTLRLEDLMRKFKTLSEREQKLQTAKLRVALGRMGAVAKGVSEAGRGLDFEMTNLRSLGYQNYGTAVSDNRPFLVGRTDEVTIDEIRVHDYRRGETETVARWRAGVYRICINQRAFVKGDLAGIHFIPEREPAVKGRHMHHKASANGYKSPLLWDPYTCWSEFGPPVTTAMAEMNIVELFRLLRIFVGRYYNGSPLVQPDNRSDQGRDLLKFMERIA